MGEIKGLEQKGVIEGGELTGEAKNQTLEWRKGRGGSRVAVGERRGGAKVKSLQKCQVPVAPV